MGELPPHMNESLQASPPTGNSSPSVSGTQPFQSYQQPFTPYGTPPTQKKHVSLWLTILTSVLCLVLGAVIGIFLPFGNGASSSTEQDPQSVADVSDLASVDVADPTHEAVDLLLSAPATCGVSSHPYIDVLDDGWALWMKSDGNESAGAHIEDIACVLVVLDMPQRTISKIDSTRALDGRQTDSWDNFEASWSYHPDSGMDLLIEVVDD